MCNVINGFRAEVLNGVKLKGPAISTGVSGSEGIRCHIWKDICDESSEKGELICSSTDQF